MIASLRVPALLASCVMLGGCAGHSNSPADRPLYVSPSGQDAAACTRERPCRSLSHALHRVGAGGEIRMLGGRYPDQSLDGAPRPGAGGPVVVRPDDGARVRLGVLEIAARRLEIRGLRMVGWHAVQGAGHLTFRDVHTDWFFVDSVSDLRILGGTVGPADSVDSQIRAADGGLAPANILIDGVTFRDFTARKDPTQHVECLQFGSGEHVMVRRSRFLNCATHAVFVNAWGGTKVHDFTFEDNRFGSVPDGFYSLRVGRGDPGSTSDIAVRHNSAITTMQVDEGIPGVSFVGNLAPRAPWECFSDQRYVGNVWSRVRCGATDREAGTDAVLRAAGNGRLRNGAAAVGPSPEDDGR